MNTNLAIGVFALAYGIFTLAMRLIAPQSKLFAKLGPMKERFGNVPGTIVHWVAYTIAPIAMGTVLVYQAKGQ